MLDRLVAVKGSVLSIESDGKVYPRVSAFIVFKRVNCASCLVAFRTDATGKYSMILGEGKYEVFVMEFERNGKSYNALAPDQPRFIQVKEPTDGSYYQSSDIKIVTRGQSVVLDFSPDIGKEQSFLDKVLSDDNCRDCYFIVIEAESIPYTGKVVVENDNLRDFLFKTEGVIDTRYKDYAKELILSKRKLLIEDAFLDNSSIRNKYIGHYQFRVVGEFDEVESIASLGCVPFIKYYFLGESLNTIQNPESVDCKEFIRKQNKDLSLTRDGSEELRKQSAIISKLFEWEIPIRMDHYSGWLTISKRDFQKSADK